MKEDKLSLQWVLLLAALSGFGLVNLPAKDSPSDPPKSELAETAPTNTHRTTVELPGAAKALAALGPCPARLVALARAGYRPEVVLATVPDPLDSLYPRLFDHFLTALRRASEQAGYSEDRTCLPWADIDPGAKDDPAYRREPGWMLFRRYDGSDKPETLAILLVGESPPRGIQEAALATALDEALLYGPTPTAKAPLRLLGPTFSSSVVSLGLTLREWSAKLPASAPLPIEIRSGTTTASDLDTVLARLLPAEQATAGRLSLASFSSAATPDEQMRKALLERFFHDDLDLDVPLTSNGEEATDSKPRPTESSALDRAAQVAMLVESSLYGKGFKESQGPSTLIVPFPMHISTLRAEYEKEWGAKAKTGEGGDPKAGLSLATGGDAQPRDALRVFDVTGTSRSQDLELTLLLSDVARERIPMVGIVATNVRDTLFLARLVEKHAPDVRLFTFEGDLLLSHPSYSSATKGMLVASSQPLFERTEGPDRAAPAQLRFGSDATQGVYRTLLRMLDPERKLAASEIWISAVGRRGLYPLRRLELEERDGKPTLPERKSEGVWAGVLRLQREIEDQTLHIPPPPRGWALIVWVFTALVLGLCWLLVQDLRQGKKSVALDWDRQRTLLALLLGLALLLPVFLTAGPALLATDRDWGKPMRLACKLDVLLLGGLVLLLLLRLVAQTRHAWRAASAASPRGSRWLAGRELTVGLVGLFSLLVLLFCNTGLLRANAGSMEYLLERTVLFGSGLSPLQPLLLLVVVILGWLLLAWRRLGVLEAQPTCLEAGAGWNDKLSLRFRDALAEVCWALHPIGKRIESGAEQASHSVSWRRPTTRVVLWCLLLAAPMLYLSYYFNRDLWPRPAVRSLEHWGYDWEISMLFALAVACVLEAGVALWRGWRSLQRLMSELQDLRVGEAGDPAAEGAVAGWLAKIAAAGKPVVDGEARLLERRDRALRDFTAELEKTAAGVFPKAELEGLRAALPAASRPGEISRLWLTVAGWVAATSPAGPGLGAKARLANAAADFLAWQAALSIGETSSRLIDLMRFLTIGLVGIMLAVSLYPFEPERVISFYVGSMIAAAVLLSMLFVLQAEKNPMLSHLAGTEAGRINWHRSLLQKLGLYAVVPLLTLLTRQVPQLQQLLGGLLEPLSKVFS